MSDVQVASMTMNKYGIDADIKVAIGDFASMIYMIGSYVDTGPGAVEPIREAVWVKVLEAKKLVDAYPELREEEGFYIGYYLANCALLLALDAYLDIKPLHPLGLPLTPQEGNGHVGDVNPNFKKFFH